MINDDINDFMPSILNPRRVRRHSEQFSLTQNSIVSRCSLSLKKKGGIKKPVNNFRKKQHCDKENSQDPCNTFVGNQTSAKKILNSKLNIVRLTYNQSDNEIENSITHLGSDNLHIQYQVEPSIPNNCNIELPTETETCKSLSVKSCSSNCTDNSNPKGYIEKTFISLSFTLNDCKELVLSTKNTNLKNVFINNKNSNLSLHCIAVEDSNTCSTESELDDNMNEIISSPLKRSAATINVEIKKKKLSSDDSAGGSKVLYLNTNAIDKLSHVIVQPPKYKLVKQVKLDKSKVRKGVQFRKSAGPSLNNEEKASSVNLKQKSLDTYIRKDSTDSNTLRIVEERSLSCGGDQIEGSNVGEMSNNLDLIDVNKFDRLKHKGRNDAQLSGSSKFPQTKRSSDLKQSDSRSHTDASPKGKLEGARSASARHRVDCISFCLPPANRPLARNAVSPTNIPYHKIVAGTHFAVDAFNYGEIPNVKYYFLTHFHSDHYCGLKKSFNKKLFCSNITANLCMKKLGVNSKYIQVIKIDETINLDGIDVTTVDANHCPGAVMLVFTLPNGKTILHTGDFRASLAMESYPIFWNKEIHTIYLDTTYCNPRYDFPTQDQSLDMALCLLRQKEIAVKKEGKKLSSVLIICGTYIIGKEKFFLGMARRLGCLVWACPEKDKILQAVEGTSFCTSPPQACQLHVVPMRDLTHERLKAYLDSLNGAFSEVVAFKPSGWENSKTSTVQKDAVTIHGIPYSEHSSFSELVRFVKFIQPKQVVPTVDISGGVKAVQKHFPCPLVCKEQIQNQSRLTDYFSIKNRQHSAIT